MATHRAPRKRIFSNARFFVGRSSELTSPGPGRRRNQPRQEGKKGVPATLNAMQPLCRGVLCTTRPHTQRHKRLSKKILGIA